MSISKLAQDIEELERTLIVKRGELMKLLGGNVIPLVEPMPPKRVTPKSPSKVVKGPSIADRVRSELSKRPGGISFHNLCQLPALANENKASVKNALKMDRARGEAWFDGSLYCAGKKPTPKKKTPAAPVKAPRGSAGSGEATSSSA